MTSGRYGDCPVRALDERTSLGLTGQERWPPQAQGNVIARRRVRDRQADVPRPAERADAVGKAWEPPTGWAHGGRDHHAVRW